MCNADRRHQLFLPSPQDFPQTKLHFCQQPLLQKPKYSCWGWLIYTHRHTEMQYALSSVILHKCMCWVHSQRTLPADGSLIHSHLQPLKPFAPLTCCQLSPSCISGIVWHSLSLSLPIFCPLDTEDSPFQNFQWMPSSEEEGQRRLPPKQQSQQTETWDPVLVTVWISGSLLQFVITSWALKHCPNMFCCESTDPVWHYFKERGQWSSLLITVIRNRGGGLRHL